MAKFTPWNCSSPAKTTPTSWPVELSRGPPEFPGLIAASVGLAIPQDRTMYGYLAEHASYGQTSKRAGDYAEDLAATMLATTLGIRFNVDDSYDEKRERQLFEIYREHYDFLRIYGAPNARMKDIENKRTVS
jgi:pyruvoyl-dependent arginine decarboxylase (PvlArgDC)